MQGDMFNVQDINGTKTKDTLKKMTFTPKSINTRDAIICRFGQTRAHDSRCHAPVHSHVHAANDRHSA